MSELTKLINGIACAEMHGSNTGEFTINSSQLTRIYRCAWADRIDLAVALLGEVTVDASGNSVQIPPKAHPEVPTLYAQRVRIDLFEPKVKGIVSDVQDLDDAAIAYEFARLTVDYLPFVAEFGPGDQLITEEFEVSTETLEVPGAGYVYSDATTVPHADKVHKVIGLVEDQIVFHRSASSKRSVIKSLAGKVNAAALADTQRGSMIFLGGRGRRSILTSGVEQWELGYKFRSRTTDDSSNVDEWQKVFRPGHGWKKLVRKDSSPTFDKGVYDYGDFTQLFS